MKVKRTWRILFVPFVSFGSFIYVCMWERRHWSTLRCNMSQHLTFHFFFFEFFIFLFTFYILLFLFRLFHSFLNTIYIHYLLITVNIKTYTQHEWCSLYLRFVVIYFYQIIWMQHHLFIISIINVTILIFIYILEYYHCYNYSHYHHHSYYYLYYI